MKTLKYFLSALMGSLILTACGPATDITATWNNPDIRVSAYDNLLVTAMVQSVSSREVLETELAMQIRKKGVQVTEGMKLFPPSLRDEKMGSKKELLNSIEENKFDGIITVTLIESETETRYMPGNNPYSPITTFSFYGNFWGYYNYWYPLAYNPGYYDETKSYFLETNLYDAETEKLVWSAQSETVDPVTIQSFSEDYSKVITEKLVQENLISG